MTPTSVQDETVLTRRGPGERWPGPRPRFPGSSVASKRARAGLLLLLPLLLAVAAASCTSSTRALPDAPNVILVTLDTLRADHLGCYGYSRPTSPRIDGFSRRATLYEHALATAPW